MRNKLKRLKGVEQETVGVILVCQELHIMALVSLMLCHMLSYNSYFRPIKSFRWKGSLRVVRHCSQILPFQGFAYHVEEYNDE